MNVCEVLLSLLSVHDARPEVDRIGRILVQTSEDLLVSRIVDMTQACYYRYRLGPSLRLAHPSDLCPLIIRRQEC